MVDKPEEKDSEKEVDRRFQETLGRLVNTPHKPHEKSPSAVKKAGAKGGKAS